MYVGKNRYSQKKMQRDKKAANEKESHILANQFFQVSPKVLAQYQPVSSTSKYCKKSNNGD